VPRIVAAGLLGGALDFLYASFLTVVLVGAPFARVWQGVATGWIGKAALDYGWASAALGIVTHFGIAIVMAAAYALAATRAPALYRRPWIAGVLYGLILYLVMYLVVLPLRFPQTFPRWDGVQSLMDIAAHVGVGVIIAIVLSRRRD
jgi:uncharacterized membrane protein YagU involved in acid resistance